MWYLELKKLSKQIQKAGGSRTDADMAVVIIAHTPEEYAVNTKRARNEMKERTKNNKDYLQPVLDIYQNFYKDVKKVTKKDEQDVSFYAQHGGRFKGNCRKCGKYGHKAENCRSNPSGGNPNQPKREN